MAHETFWLVAEGAAVEASGTEEWDGTNSVMAYADTAAEALALAAAYDAGRIQPDNVATPTGTVAALRA